jgi:hypothetical protein
LVVVLPAQRDKKYFFCITFVVTSHLSILTAFHERYSPFPVHALRGLLGPILLLLEEERLVQFLVMALAQMIAQFKSIQKFGMNHFWRKEEGQ